jgi:RHS repeat-associated protein
VVPVNTGTNTISVQAKDTSPNANTRTKQYSVSVDAASGKTFTYDLVGNMISDSTKTYTWDVENRLVKIVYSDNSSTDFAYDGLSRRVKALERDAAGLVISEKRFIWCGGNQPSEERNSSNTVTIRYFAQGEQVIDPSNSSLLASYFYTKDHLGSIRELTDSTGAIRARYDYDLWGNRTKLSGDLDTIVSFTGHHLHVPSGLLGTMNRFYDSLLSRWISMDPIGIAGGNNTYSYVLNDPVNYWDPMGLSTSEDLQALYEISGGEGSLAEAVKKDGDKITKEMAEAALEAANTTASLIPGEGIANRTICQMAKKPDIKFIEYLAKKLGLNRRKLGDYLEKAKKEAGMPANRHDKEFAEEVAREFKETGGH